MDILVRRAEPADFDAVFRNFQDESAYSGTLQMPFPSREEWRKKMAEPIEGHYLLVACIGTDVVGHAGLHPERAPRRAHTMALGMAVPSAFQGRGVGKALMGGLIELADNWLNVFRLELTVFTDNARAIGLYRKFGFEIEGTHKAYAMRAGRYVDTHSMARVKPKVI